MGSSFTVNERVRWIDCDAAGIIYYGSYIRFFEIAETEMYRSMGLPYAVAFSRLGCCPIRAAYHCEYLLPARLDDAMDVEIWISHLGRTSYTLGFRYSRNNGEEVLAGGYCRLVCVDLIDKRPIPIPDILREGLGGYTDLERDPSFRPDFPTEASTSGE